MIELQSDKQAPPATEKTASDVRSGEEEKLWFRSDRFCKVENQWFFTTRENCEVGPYATLDDAKHGLSLFIDCIENQHTEVDYAISIALKGDWAVARFQ